MAILELLAASKSYPIRGGLWRTDKRLLRAVDAVSLAITASVTTSIVGESGCGKTTTLKLLLGMEAPTGGEVRFRGKDLGTLRADETQDYRRAVTAVFQDPSASLNPRQSVGWSIIEALRIRGEISSGDGVALARELLGLVGLRAGDVARYPHEFSGGQRQRIAIARAIASNPEAVILDEPVSALDVSVRAQILNLLMDLQQQKGLGYAMVSHDLATVWAVSDRVVVMYLGRVVEAGPAAELRRAPLHPYTALLIAAAPGMTRASLGPVTGAGDLPSPLDQAPGCAFHPRCPRAEARCRIERPESRAEGNREVACHFPR